MNEIEISSYFIPFPSLVLCCVFLSDDLIGRNVINYVPVPINKL